MRYTTLGRDGRLFDGGEPTGGTATLPPAATPPAPATPATPPAPTPATEQNNDANMWRRKAEEAQAQAKVLQDKERKREEAEMSELQLAQSRAETAERAASEATTKALKLQIAAELGVPASALNLLTGADEAAMRSQAEAIIALTGAKPATPVQGGTITQPPAAPQLAYNERVAAAVKANNPLEAIRLMRNEQFQSK